MNHQMKNQFRQYHMRKNTQYTKSECRFFEEVISNCVEGSIDNMVVMQHKVGKIAILDIAVPELMIGYRVMGEVHGMPFAVRARDDLQKYYLQGAGWDIIDIWHSERPDLWK